VKQYSNCEEVEVLGKLCLCLESLLYVISLP